jgi:hypothetical protein
MDLPKGALSKQTNPIEVMLAQTLPLSLLFPLKLHFWHWKLILISVLDLFIFFDYIPACYLVLN